MRFIHTGDLHIGKTVSDFSQISDQRFVLDQMVAIAVSEKADTFIVAGDVYDRAVPPAEAVQVLDLFLTRLLDAGIQVILISGNHDSPERLGFGESILQKQGLYIAGTYRQPLRTVMLEDETGPVEFVLMPFVRPAAAEAGTTQEAVKAMLSGIADSSGNKIRQVLITHFFVTDSGREPELSDAETTVHVGGIDNVDVSLFDNFDYTALGHIHKPQQIGGKPVYYAGAPLAYSFSECSHAKSLNLVELGEMGTVRVERIELKALHRMRKVRGSMEELLAAGAGDENREDYIQAVLTDEGELIDPAGVLRSVYPNLMQIVLAKRQRELEETGHVRHAIHRKETAELFEDFYRLVRGEEMDEEHRKVVLEAVKQVEGGGL